MPAPTRARRLSININVNAQPVNSFWSVYAADGTLSLIKYPRKEAKTTVVLTARSVNLATRPSKASRRCADFGAQWCRRRRLQKECNSHTYQSLPLNTEQTPKDNKYQPINLRRAVGITTTRHISSAPTDWFGPDNHSPYRNRDILDSSNPGF